jgi:hypothetical protein
MMKKVLVGIVVVAFVSTGAFGQLYSEDFEVDPTASWTVNNGPSDSTSNFFFDYSTVGIPAAPSGPGTHGMKLQANLTDATFSGVSASPTGQSFGGDYTLSFDWWANFNGPFPGGGSGSTNLSTYGIGTAGTFAQWAGGTQDSVWFGATGDGGSGTDWRAYSTAAGTGYDCPSGVFAAGNVAGCNNAPDPHYAGFGSVEAPAAQLALFPQQNGTTSPGTGGMDWHDVEIQKAGTTATWKVDGTLIATIDLSTVTLGGGNIFSGHSDINGSSSSDPNAPALLFTLIDNINVVPEPSAFLLLAVSGLLLAFRRR